MITINKYDNGKSIKLIDGVNTSRFYNKIILNPHHKMKWYDNISFYSTCDKLDNEYYVVKLLLSLTNYKYKLIRVKYDDSRENVIFYDEHKMCISIYNKDIEITIHTGKLNFSEFRVLLTSSISSLDVLNSILCTLELYNIIESNNYPMYTDVYNRYNDGFIRTDIKLKNIGIGFIYPTDDYQVIGDNIYSSLTSVPQLGNLTYIETYVDLFDNILLYSNNINQLYYEDVDTPLLIKLHTIISLSANG